MKWLKNCYCQESTNKNFKEQPIQMLVGVLDLKTVTPTLSFAKRGAFGLAKFVWINNRG
jgi:hypothetical protein